MSASAPLFNNRLTRTVSNAGCKRDRELALSHFLVALSCGQMKRCVSIPVCVVRYCICSFDQQRWGSYLLRAPISGLCISSTFMFHLPSHEKVIDERKVSNSVPIAPRRSNVERSRSRAISRIHVETKGANDVVNQDSEERLLVMRHFATHQ